MDAVNRPIFVDHVPTWLLRDLLAAIDAAQSQAQLTPMRASMPERIWLQINPVGDEDDESEPVESVDGITWCHHSVGGQEVMYVRADLATQAPPAAAVDGEHPTANARALRSCLNRNE